MTSLVQIFRQVVEALRQQSITRVETSWLICDVKSYVSCREISDGDEAEVYDNRDAWMEGGSLADGGHEVVHGCKHQASVRRHHQVLGAKSLNTSSVSRGNANSVRQIENDIPAA